LNELPHGSENFEIFRLRLQSAHRSRRPWLLRPILALSPGIMLPMVHYVHSLQTSNRAA
jgi:hypothetical protein